MKKRESGQKEKPYMTTDELIEREKAEKRRNRLKNRPIIFMTYVTAILFLSLFAYIIYFVYHDADKVIANTSNKRQDVYAKNIIRGDIVTSDGVTVATTAIDSSGNETRSYPYGKLFCHSVGYNSYGRSGIELSMNFYMLRSHNNIVSQVKNDLMGEKNIGDTVVTTLDYKLQNAASNALNGNKGAVIVMEPDTGKILVNLSNPGFDPNDIDNVWEEIHTEEGKESTIMLNRATQGLYAPGSTFKTLTLLEYIRENPQTYNDYSYVCESKGKFNDVTIHCAHNNAHGTVNLEQSLAHSCNTSFSNIGIGLDMDGLHSLADDMMFNSSLPYDFAYNKSSFSLDSTSDKSAIPQTVIGQGDTKITPLHNALIMSSVANGGILMKPYMVDRVENSDGAVITRFGSSSYDRLISTDEASVLTEYLKSVCEYGTASSQFGNTSYKVAGKTGTAEYDNEGNCNSWFVGFSNPENPDIVVSVIVEDYNSNQLSGAYVARKIFDAYYN